MTTTQTTRKFKRCPKDQAWGTGYISTDGKWAIFPEGSSTHWVVAQIGEDTYPIDETSSYHRSYQECKNYIAWKDAKEAEVK